MDCSVYKIKVSSVNFQWLESEVLEGEPAVGGGASISISSSSLPYLPQLIRRWEFRSARKYRTIVSVGLHTSNDSAVASSGWFGFQLRGQDPDCSCVPSRVAIFCSSGKSVVKISTRIPTLFAEQLQRSWTTN